MKEYLAARIRKLISPSIRFEVREASAWLRDLLGRACFWRWEVARFKLRKDSPYDILYIGRKVHREMAKVLMGVESPMADSQSGSGKSDHRVLVSEMPTLGALYVPHFLSAIVPLGRPIEDITARYHSQLRRDLRKNQLRYRMRQALTDNEIEKADREMLQPYATARHGTAASQMATHEVLRIAKTVGRLDLILLEDKIVACQLGCVTTRDGKRYWTTIRVGYPEVVFSDDKRLKEVNSICIFMALERAIEDGLDYYDIGTSLARPDDGLLEWKRRRGGEVDTLGNYAYMFVRLPKVGAAQLLWEAPLFAVEGKKLTLHLGLPDGQNDEDVASRYRNIGFGGLYKIYLYCAKSPSELLIDTLRSRYDHLKSPPIVERIIST